MKRCGGHGSCVMIQTGIAMAAYHFAYGLCSHAVRATAARSSPRRTAHISVFVLFTEKRT